MKRIYTYLLMLTALLLTGTTSVFAQDDELVTIEVNSKTGDWTAANPARTWASKWESYGTPSLIIEHTTADGTYHANNMNYWGTSKSDISFYSSYGGRTTSENYYLRATGGYTIYSVSFDFVCSNDKGVSIDLNGTGAVENYSNTETEHVEVTDLIADEVYFTVATATDGVTFANTSNFVVQLAPKSKLDAAWEELTATVNDYMTYYAESIEESYFKIGTEPGLYGETEVRAFYDALNKGIAGDVDESDVDAAIQTLQQMKQDIIDTYEAVIASKVMAYPVADGYYRFRTAMTYVNDDVETVKYMMGYKTNGTLRAIWATPEEGDVTDQAMALWKITNKDGKLDVQNVFHDGRFNNVARSTAISMSPESENLMIFDPVTTIDGQTTFNIRVATQDAANGIYLHQNGHSSGAGTNGYIVGYYTSYNYATSAPGGSEWILETVGDDEAAQIIEAYAPIKEREAFEEAYTQLTTEATAALGKAKDYILTALITDNAQFSSPWTESSEGSINNLIDGNSTTYWHSAWSGGSVENHTHYLQVALNEPTHELVRMTITRRPVANDHITLWGVFGSNDPEAADEEWVEITSIATPFGNNTETISSQLFDTQGYQYLRFYIDNTTGTNGSNSRGYGHVSEFQLYEAQVNPTSQYVLMGDVAKNLEQVLNNQSAKEIADVQQEDYDALKAAYDTFVAQYVDPAELRNVLATAKALAGGVVVGNQPGYWKDTTVADALKKTITDAKAYDEAGAYVAARSNEFIQTLQKQADAITAAAIGVETGKWYRIHFASEADFEKYGWDLVAGAALVNNDDVQTDEELWDKYITVARNETTDVIHEVMPTYAEDVRLGANLFLDADADIEEKDLSMFRFVAVGDSAYALQNKGTGLFVHAAGTSGAVTLSLHPSLFSVRAIGYGQNVIAAKSLTGASQNNLHAQRSYNLLVTWNADTPGSRSGLYLEEEEQVAADYEGTDFNVDIYKGQIYAHCYPVNLSATEGQLYDVAQYSGKQLTLIPIKEANAGRPFLYILGETEDFDAEGESDEITLKHGYDFVAEPQAQHLLKGTFTSQDLGSGIIIPQNNGFTVTNFMSGTIAAYSAFIRPEETVTTADEITFVIDADTPDDIQTALQNVTRRGEIYTIDGRLVSRQGNLNDLRKLGRGTYIVGGTKVLVK